MEAKRRRRRGVEGLRAALKQFSESSLSVRDFCEREGLGLVSFYQWRTRPRARSAEGESPAASAEAAHRPVPIYSRWS